MSNDFERFCGGTFWDANLTWSNDVENPDFTPCFHRTIFVWTPVFFLAILAPFEVRRYRNSKSHKIPRNWYNTTKLVLTLCLAIMAIVDLILLATGGDNGKAVVDADYVAAAFYVFGSGLSLFLLVASLIHGIRTSPAQFVYYLVATVCGAVTLRSIVVNGNDNSQGFTQLTAVYSVTFAMTVLMLWLNCFADREPRDYDPRLANQVKPSPYFKASFPSKATFDFMTPLLWTGFRRPLVNEDLWQLEPEHTAAELGPAFQAHLFKEDDSGPVSLLPALLLSYGSPFFIGTSVKILADMLALVSPQIMSLLIGHVESSYTDDPTVEPEASWKGYVYAAAMLTVLVSSTLLNQYQAHLMYVIGMNIKTTVTASVYKKALKLSGSAKKETTVGEIVNLMSVDVQRFMDLVPYLNMLFASPIQIALSAYFMYQELGAAMFAGMAVLVLAIPLNAAVTGISRRFQVEQMKNKDERVMLMNEILGGIKVLKLYAWEKSFIKQILDIRLREIVVLKKAAWMRAMFNFVWNNVPFMMSLACFTTYIFMDGGNVLTAQKAFVTMSYINLIKIPMMFIPFLIIGAIQVSVSISRLNKFMNGGELDLMIINKLPMDKDEPISVEEATFRWADDDPVVLRDIDFKVKRGSLTAVVGPVGSGKSSLIGALLGELEKDSGRVNVSGSVAYVPQQAWMQNASVQDNILFGTEFSQMTYLKAIDACALKTDLEILPGGDQTEIGEKGINLSGGQKQRVSLARAVYNDADIYLLDDPLSAVDSHVGKHIFEEVIGSRGALRNKTTILVTHGITYLPKTDHIIVMKDGRISEQGSYRELVERKGDFAAFLIEHMAEAGISEDDHEIKAQLEETMGEEFRRELDRQRSRKASVGSSVISDTEDEATDKEYEKEGAAQPAVLQHNGNAEKGARLIEKETAETGSVKNDVYMHYVKSVGMKSALIAFAMQAISTVFFVLTNLWLDVWTGEGKGSSEDPEIRNLYLGVYGGLGAASGLAMLVLAIIIAVITLNGSLIMHQDMLKRILHCPMSFFDTTPLGRIVNRFAKDVDVCDNTLPAIIQNWLNILFQALATMVLIVTPIPYFLAVLVPIGVIFLIVQKIFIAASRQLKRLESISRSPIYSHFGETLQGASTIKAYGMEHRFIMDNELKVDTNQAAYFPGLHLNRWLAIRLEGLGALVTFGSAIFILLFPESVDPSDVGLVITYSLSITQLFNWLVRMASDLETNIVAVERIKEYSTSIESEAEWETSHRPKDSWPEHGSLEFTDFAMRYRPGLDLVLKGVKCQIKGGETVGIVGRTGAGKSSLTVALFRLVESASGSIVIDGEDISKMGLHDLRKKLTIIPQDPVLFSGSLRMNLDPFEEHSDEALWHALELSHLKEFVSGLENGLDYEISEAGENVSVGQRQLVCLARALLRKTKVLILDEATAAVDLETDDLIQSTIRKEFKGCTVLTIAHRLNTILDYNRIMVLDKGVIVEFDSPDKLLVDETTIFHSMAKNANLV